MFSSPEDKIFAYSVHMAPWLFWFYDRSRIRWIWGSDGLDLRLIKLHYLFVLMLGSRRTSASKGPKVDSPGSRRMYTGDWWKEN